MTDWDKIFNSVCRVVLKDELGKLDDYAGFLTRYVDPVKSTKSSISGKAVYYTDPYCGKSKMISFEEVNKIKIEPLKLDEMKDIDLLRNAISERFYYSGNKVLGNSDDAVESENVFDSFHVYQSHDVMNCESVGYCQMLIKACKFSFGCSWGDTTTFCINTSETSVASRSFESGLIINTSDAYFSYNCMHCNDVIFCFNQRSTRHAIGNSVLEKDKYNSLKEKLLSEVVSDLKKNKTYPSLMDLVFGES